MGGPRTPSSILSSQPAAALRGLRNERTIRAVRRVRFMDHRMAERYGLGMLLAVLALSGMGAAGAKAQSQDIEQERRSRLVEGLGPEYSRVDSISVVVVGIPGSPIIRDLETVRQRCPAVLSWVGSESGNFPLRFRVARDEGCLSRLVDGR